jgi:hypothetical protein
MAKMCQAYSSLLLTEFFMFANPLQPSRWLRTLTQALCLLGAASGTAQAALQDEIQVYDDKMTTQDHFRMDLHVNTTPSGNTTPSYADEVVSSKAWRFTPELIFGLNKDIEAAAYAPVVRKPDGTLYLAGLEARVKWMPVKPTKGGDGFFAGLSWKVSALKNIFSESANNLEMRPVLGSHAGRWLWSVNPGLNWQLSTNSVSGTKRSSPEFNLSAKVGFALARDLSYGLEYYSYQGALGDRLAYAQQNNRLFFVADYDGYSLGIGKNTTDGADRWTLKALFNVPMR